MPRLVTRPGFDPTCTRRDSTRPARKPREQAAPQTLRRHLDAEGDRRGTVHQWYEHGLVIRRQEVSAATEELSAQANEVVSTAVALANLATQLDGIVARFAIDGPAKAGTVTSFRRQGPRPPDAVPLSAHRPVAVTRPGGFRFPQ